MKIIGVTGSIATGKTVLSKNMHTRGGALFNADAEIHELLKNEAKSIILNIFPSVRDKDNAIDRKKLGVLVFADKEELKKLEDVLHPMIRQKTLNFLRISRLQGYRYAIIDVPLLYENGLQKYCDVVVLAYASFYVQSRRLKNVRKLDGKTQKAILAKQMKLTEKCKYADIIVNMNVNIVDSKRKILAIKKRLVV